MLMFSGCQTERLFFPNSLQKHHLAIGLADSSVALVDLLGSFSLDIPAPQPGVNGQNRALFIQAGIGNSIRPHGGARVLTGLASADTGGTSSAHNRITDDAHGGGRRRVEPRNRKSIQSSTVTAPCLSSSFSSSPLRLGFACCRRCRCWQIDSLSTRWPEPNCWTSIADSWASIHVSIFLSVHLSIIHCSVSLSIYLPSISLSVQPFIYYLLVGLSVHFSIIYWSIYLSIWNLSEITMKWTLS